MIGNKKRLAKQLQIIKNQPLGNYTVQIIDQDITHWHAKLIPPIQSIYQGGQYILDIKINFITPIYHPNIMDNGKICYSVFYHWSPALMMNKVLLEIYCMFTEMNPQESWNVEVGNQYRKEYDKFLANVRNFVNKYAMKQQNKQKDNQ